MEREAATIMDAVRRPSTPDQDGVIYVSMSSSESWLAVSLRLPSRSGLAFGEITRFRKVAGSATVAASPEARFQIPQDDYVALVRRLDGLTDGWPGTRPEPHQCYDGRAVAFERARGRRVTSGVGNASCDRHYGQVSQVLDGFVARFAPKLG